MAELRYEDIKRAVQEILQQESLNILRDLRHGHQDIRRQTQHLEQMYSQLQDVSTRIQTIQRYTNSMDSTARNSGVVLQTIQSMQHAVGELHRRVASLEQSSVNIQRMAVDYQQRHTV